MRDIFMGWSYFELSQWVYRCGLTIYVLYPGLTPSHGIVDDILEANMIQLNARTTLRINDSENAAHPSRLWNGVVS